MGLLDSVRRAFFPTQEECEEDGRKFMENLEQQKTPCVGNPRSMKYHTKSSCLYSKDAQRGKTVRFSNEADAIRGGYAQCNWCRKSLW